MRQGAALRIRVATGALKLGGVLGWETREGEGLVRDAGEMWFKITLSAAENRIWQIWYKAEEKTYGFMAAQTPRGACEISLMKPSSAGKYCEGEKRLV